MEEKTTSETERQALKLYIKMMRAANTVTEKMHRHLTDKKLTISQFGVLEALYHLGPLTQKTIGEKLLKTSGNITMVIDNLEKQKLVIRERGREDRRCFNVALTSEGRELIHNLFPLHANTACRVFSVLTQEEQETLGALLKKIGTADLVPQTVD